MRKDGRCPWAIGQGVPPAVDGVLPTSTVFGNVTIAFLRGIGGNSRQFPTPDAASHWQTPATPCESAEASRIVHTWDPLELSFRKWRRSEAAIERKVRSPLRRRSSAERHAPPAESSRAIFASSAANLLAAGRRATLACIHPLVAGPSIAS